MSHELINYFIQEANDYLEKAEQSFLNLEKYPDKQEENIVEAFRSLHNIKGNSAIIGYSDIELLAHKAESVLGEIKKGNLSVKEQHIEIFLLVVDKIRNTIDDIEKGGKGFVKNIENIETQLDEILYNEVSSNESLDYLNGIHSEYVISPKPDSQEEKQDLGSQDPVHREAIENTIQKEKSGEPLEIKHKSENDTQYLQKIEVKDIKPESKQEEHIKPEQTKAQQIKLDEIIPDLPKPEKKPKKENKNIEDPKNVFEITKRKDIRVDLKKLDALNNLIGELVIAESMVAKNPDLEGYEFENFERATRHLNRIVRDLQDLAMSVRMIPISIIFNKMERLVRHVSSRGGKKSRLQIVGGNTEIDKTVAELIHDPLVHIIRNAIDHGIEIPALRKAVGKNESGVVRLEAQHEGGEIWIGISDDGTGLNRKKILAKGIKTGIVDGDGKSMSDDEIYQLIFEHGFSTADKVTDISGRGVGMDVVKKNIENLNGKIDIRSKANIGTSIIIRIPLTLSIIDGMMVRLGGSKYSIPLLCIRESIQVKEEHIIKTMDGQEIVKLRDELLPVLRLHELFNIEPDYPNIVDGLLIVIQEHSGSLCLLVDEILGQHQAVVKGLSNYIFKIGNLKGVSGCTILGDGTISLILDAGKLIEIARDNSYKREEN